MAPTGSSILNFRSTMKMLSITRTPAMHPMTAAAQGSTKAQGAVMATKPASMPLAIMPGSGFPVRSMIHTIAMMAPKAAAIAVSVATIANWTSVAAKRRGGVEAEPAEQQDERAQHGHGDVMTRQRPGLAVLAELADASAEHDGTGQGGEAAHGVDDAGTGEVDVAEAEADAVTELGQPAAAPGQAGEQRVVERAAEQTPHDEALPLPPLRHRPRRDRGRGVHEGHHVEEEGCRGGEQGSG